MNFIVKCYRIFNTIKHTFIHKGGRVLLLQVYTLGEEKHRWWLTGLLKQMSTEGE